MEQGQMFFTIASAAGTDEGITFQCFTATSEAGAHRMTERLRAIRERNGFPVRPVTVLATRPEDGD